MTRNPKPSWATDLTSNLWRAQLVCRWHSPCWSCLVRPAPLPSTPTLENKHTAVWQCFKWGRLMMTVVQQKCCFSIHWSFFLHVLPSILLPSFVILFLFIRLFIFFFLCFIPSVISIIKRTLKHIPTHFFFSPEASPASCFVSSTGCQKVTLRPSWGSGTDCNACDPVGRKGLVRQINTDENYLYKFQELQYLWRSLLEPL